MQIRCAQQDSNLRCWLRGPASYPLDHRRVPGAGIEAAVPRRRLNRSLPSLSGHPGLGVIGGYRPLCGPGHSRTRRFSVRSQYSAKESDLRPPAVAWTGCSPIELAELACAQRDSNSHQQIRNLPSCPLNDERFVPAARAERARRPCHDGGSSAELRGPGDAYRIRTGTLHLDGVVHWPVVLMRHSSRTRTRTWKSRLTGCRVAITPSEIGSGDGI